MLNKALLAKQVWRLLMELEALWAEVMKEIYFHDKDVLKASKGVWLLKCGVV